MNLVTRLFLRMGRGFRRMLPGADSASSSSDSGIVPADLSGVMVSGETKVPLRPNELFSARALVDPSRLIAGRFFYPFNPSVLVTRKGLGVFDQMKLDEQVKVCLAFKKNTVLQAGWEVVSPGDRPADWEVTQFLHDQFMHLPDGADDFLRKILLGLDYGYSLTEKIFGPVDWAPGKVGLVKATSIKPHYIDIQANQHGEVLGIIQRYVEPKLSPDEIGRGVIPAMPPDKFILYTHDIEFENHYGRSELEAAYRPWWTKDNAYKWFAIMLERFGMPPLFFFYDPNTYQGGQLNELKNIIKAIKNATMGLLPRAKKDSLDIWSQQLAQQSKDVFLAALGRFDGDIASALLMPSLIGASSSGDQLQGGKGSYARANIHFKNFLSVIRATQRNIATRAINGQFIRQLCDLNFPGLTSYPEFRFLDPDDETELTLFELWQKLVTSKVVNRIEDDEKHIRKSLGFPENDNPVIEPLPKRTLPGDGGDEEDDDEPPEAIPEPELSEDMRQFAAENAGVWLRINGHPMCFRREAVRRAA